MTRTPAPSLAPQRAPDREGVHQIRVRYCECDPMGVAHHAAYIPWLEESRTELLRTSGVSYAQLEGAGFFLAIIRLETLYKRPARYDDLLEVRVRVSGGSRVKIHHDYEVRLLERPGWTAQALADLRHAGADLLVTGSTTLACIDADGRPRPLPDWLATVR
ncbi:MAG: acyl-CoA thioesterase [Phycisphaerales bacterium]|nr:acyl-CoA thioesterase [Phycisphaerales bacterium]